MSRQWRIPDKALGDIQIGIESEALRVRSDGSLSRNPHPFSPGDRRFTMDFAESQLEIVTEPLSDPHTALVRLNELVEEARDAIAPETLWPLSMPPELPADEDIAIADFGQTDEGRKARLYRKGLAARYGKARQMISGIHVNISAGPELERLAGRVNSSPPLLSAAGEFYRNLGSLILFTGASPVRIGSIDKPVISTRCGRAGYGRAGIGNYVDLSSIEAYTRAVEAGIRKELPKNMIRKLVENGRVLQLSKSVFQSESEYYAPLRLRRSVPAGAAQSAALRRVGPEYIELRFIDRNPFAPGGIDEDALNLIYLMFLKGLTEPSPAPDRHEIWRLLKDAQEVADTPLEIILNPEHKEGRRIRKIAELFLEKLQPLADRLDRSDSGAGYQDTLSRYGNRTDRPEGLLSAAVYRHNAGSGKEWTSRGAVFVESNSGEVEYGFPYARV